MKTAKKLFTLLTLLALILAGTSLVYAAQTDINGPAGSGAFGATVTALPNGNFVVTDPYYNIPSGAENVGAVYLYDGATLAVISTLTGSTTDDVVGFGGVTVLTNGNYVVLSTHWDNPTGPIVDAGATTWCSATTGCNGAVTVSNSLIGGTEDDSMGSNVTRLTNGNYVVNSPYWDNPTGSVVDVGAVTWSNGTGGTVGLVTSGNSLIGGSAGDNVGRGVTALTNGNYVMRSPDWNNPTGPVVDVGAVTWGNGSGGTVGLVTSSNSLIGGRESDYVGSVTALTNGNYVVSSWDWDNGATADAGAVTWGNGSGGTVGTVTLGNSLIGSRLNDQVGSSGVTALTNGNYVVRSPLWNNGAITEAGAATWGSGTGGTVGLVTSSNSLIGDRAGDQVGNNSVTALTNGNYVVSSPTWYNPTGAKVNAGAVTWGNGSGGTVGPVTSGNSLIGGKTNDQVGIGGATALTNGNYVVCSPLWDNGATADAGAATWGNGTGGTVGLVTSGNSLIGGTANNLVGYFATALTNGNYVVNSPYWDNGATADVGAVTWGNGTAGTVGLVTSGNSLIGGRAGDNVGVGVTALTNGNYVVQSGVWDNPSGPIVDVGAVTWGNGLTGTVGLVTSDNSLIGGTANDIVGYGSDVTALTNGNYVIQVQSSNWDNPAGPVGNAGFVTFGNGSGGTAGLVTSADSILGTVANGISPFPGFSFDATRNRLVVGRRASNMVSLLDCPFCNTTTTITSHTPNPSIIGQAVVVNFTVTSSGGTPTGNVTVTDGTVNCSGTVAAGTCTLTPTSTGAKTLTATYAGDGYFFGSISAGVGHQVKANTTTTITSHTPDPSVVGQAVVVNFTVTSSNGTPTGNVTITDGTVNCSGTVAAGTCTLTPTSAGAKTLTATYAGDVSFFGSISAGVAHQVNANTTTTTITSHTPNPSVIGQAVVVNFTVTSSGGTPTGNVTVSDGSVSCSGTVAAGTCMLTPTSTGAKTLIATYAGDANFLSSISAGVAHQVNASLFLPLILR